MKSLLDDEDMRYNKRSFMMNGQEMDMTNNDQEESSSDHEDDDHDDNQDAYEETDNIVDASAPMPGDFYENVDQFLSRPPPKLGTITKKSSKSTPSIPALKKERDELQKKIRLNPGGESSKPPIRRKSEKSVEPKRFIDESLLMQAMEYTDKLMRDNVLEELREMPSYVKNARLPPNNTNQIQYEQIDYGIASKGPTASQSKYKNKDMDIMKKQKSNKQPTKKNSLVKKLRAQTKIYSNDNEFNVSTESDQSSNRNPLDFDALVANFEQGLTLRKLQAELEESKINIMRSQDAVKKISAEYSRKIYR
eukprot:gene2754-5422_t